MDDSSKDPLYFVYGLVIGVLLLALFVTLGLVFGGHSGYYGLNPRGFQP